VSLISKKDLLAVTGISYGQLYRWKRQKLIPEEWFIKKSSYTGQETFFPREQIVSRVQSILELKDKHSLEELAHMLSPGSSNVQALDKQEMYAIEEVSPQLAALLEAGGKEIFPPRKIVYGTILYELAQQAGLSEEQTAKVFSNSLEAFAKQENMDVLCTLFRIEGEHHAVLTAGTQPVLFDRSVVIAGQIYVGDRATSLQLKYKWRAI
jgi:hypothetical protein